MERNKKLDICKFFAMICIILAHSLQRTLPNFNNSFSGTFLVIFGLGIFFFVSGISHGYRKPLKPLGFLYDILKRGLMYMWPIVLFLLLRVWLFNQWPTVDKAFGEFWEYPVMGMWFLWVLLWINLTVDIGLLISYFAPKYKKIFVTLMILVFYTLIIILREQNIIYLRTYLGYDYFVAYTPIFLFGYLFGDKLFTNINWKVSISLICVGLVMSILIVHYSEQMVVIDLPTHLPLFYIATTGTLLVYYGVSNLLNETKVGNVFSYFGRFTLEAYFLHLMIVKNWGGMRITDQALCTGWTIGIFLACIADIFAVLIICYYVPFIHLLIFGKSLSRKKKKKNIFIKLKEITNK